MHLKVWLTIWPVLAFFLGGLAAILTGHLNYRREQAKQRSADRAAKEQRREEFELQHLIEFNEQLRGCVGALYEFGDTVRSYRQWRQSGGPARSSDVDVEGASADFLEALDAVYGQLGFILVDSVRAQATAAADALNEGYDAVLDSPDDEDPPTSVNREVTEACYAATAARVREIYGTPAP